MNRIPLDENALTYPMPVVLVGTLVNGHPNLMAVAWVTRVNARPPMMAIAVAKSHHTTGGIHSSGAFSVNIPGVDLVARVDHCGMVSGRKEDKAALFRTVAGEVTSAPLVEDCPLCLECRLVNVVDLPGNELIIGEVVAAYASDESRSDGKPDVAKMRPFVLTMPDNSYWSLGDVVGRAWSSGKDVKAPQQ